MPAFPTNSCRIDENSSGGEDDYVVDASALPSIGCSALFVTGTMAHAGSISLGATHWTLGEMSGEAATRPYFVIAPGTSLIEMSNSTGNNFQPNGWTLHDVQLDALVSGSWLFFDNMTAHTLTLVAGTSLVTGEEVLSPIATNSIACSGTELAPIVISGAGGTLRLSAALQPSCTWVTVSDTIASGALPFMADANSTDGGGNQGWCFGGACPDGTWTPTPTLTPTPAPTNTPTISTTTCCNVTGGITCIDATVGAGPFGSLEQCQATLDGFFCAGGGACNPGTHQCVGGDHVGEACGIATDYNGEANCSPEGDFGGACPAAIPTATPTSAGPSATPTATPAPCTYSAQRAKALQPTCETRSLSGTGSVEVVSAPSIHRQLYVVSVASSTTAATTGALTIGGVELWPFDAAGAAVFPPYNGAESPLCGDDGAGQPLILSQTGSGTVDVTVCYAIAE